MRGPRLPPGGSQPTPPTAQAPLCGPSTLCQLTRHPEPEGGHVLSSSQSPGPSVLHQPSLFTEKTEGLGPHPCQSQVRRPMVGVKKTFILNLCHKHGSGETLKTTCPCPHLGDPSPRFVSPRSQKFLPCDHVGKTPEKAVPVGHLESHPPGPTPPARGKLPAPPVEGQASSSGSLPP